MSAGVALSVVDPRETIVSMTDRVSAVPLDARSWRWWWIALAPSAALLAVGAGAILW